MKGLVHTFFLLKRFYTPLNLNTLMRILFPRLLASSSGSVVDYEVFFIAPYSEQTTAIILYANEHRAERRVYEHENLCTLH